MFPLLITPYPGIYCLNALIPASSIFQYKVFVDNFVDLYSQIVKIKKDS